MLSGPNTNVVTYFHELHSDRPCMQPLQMRASVKQALESCCQDNTALAEALSDPTLLERMMHVAGSEPLPASILTASPQATAVIVQGLQPPVRTVLHSCHAADCCKLFGGRN